MKPAEKMVREGMLKAPARDPGVKYLADFAAYTQQLGDAADRQR